MTGTFSKASMLELKKQAQALKVNTNPKMVVRRAVEANSACLGNCVATETYKLYEDFALELNVINSKH